MEAIDKYLQEITEAKAKEWKRNGYTFASPPKFTYTEGKKYFKIIENGYGGGQSVHCFVDFNGNIFKPSGWSAPAKGIRGNIHNEVKPLLCGQFYR